MRPEGEYSTHKQEWMIQMMFIHRKIHDNQLGSAAL